MLELLIVILTAAAIFCLGMLVGYDIRSYEVLEVLSAREKEEMLEHLENYTGER